MHVVATPDTDLRSYTGVSAAMVRQRYSWGFTLTRALWSPLILWSCWMY